MSFESQDTMQYPTILFCPTQWISRTKFYDLDFPEQILRYAVHFLGDALAVSTSSHNDITDFEHDRDDEELKSNLNRLNLTTVADLFRIISIDYGVTRNVNPLGTTNSIIPKCGTVLDEKVVTRSGISFISYLLA